MAVRKGPWKMHLYTCMEWGGGKKPHRKHDPPLLYNLERDSAERYNIAEKHPEIIADLKSEIKTYQATIKPVVSQLTGKMPEF